MNKFFIVLFSVSLISFNGNSFGMHYLKTKFWALFSAQARENEQVKQQLGLSMEGPHAAIVGRDAIKKDYFHSHLITLIDEAEKVAAHNNEATSGIVIYKNNVRYTITCQVDKKYAFQTDKIDPKTKTVCDKDSYTIIKNKEEFMQEAETAKIMVQSPVESSTISNFGILLERLAINKKIEDIKSNDRMTMQEKLSALKAALAERNEAFYK